MSVTVIGSKTIIARVYRSIVLIHKTATQAKTEHALYDRIFLKFQSTTFMQRQSFRFGSPKTIF